MNRITASVLVTAALSVISCNSSHEGHSANAAPTASQSQVSAIDLHNTVCPVSGDKVGSSKLTETYDGKIYHMCCADCPNDFRKNPKKYADEVAAHPTKYGVK